MKIVADLVSCDGYANCVMAADDVFDINNDGKVDVLIVEPEAGRHEAVREAVRSCPVRALSLVD